MYAMIKRAMIVLLVSMCAVSLSLHFVVESLGGNHDHFIGGQVQGMFDSHEGDQFVITELADSRFSPTQIWFRFRSKIHVTPRSLVPPFQPPKSI